MFNTKLCKNCFQSYSGKPDTCPHCGNVLRAPKPEKQSKNNQPKAKKERRRRVSSAEIMESIDFVELNAKANKERQTSGKKKNNNPEFKVEKNGEYSIDIKDVTYLPNTYTYSAKKARGEYDAPKIKWWEIYKWADVLLARRKIKKQVRRASYYRPQQFSKGTLLSLCIFLGWIGVHNFYARNYRKATFMLIAGALGAFITLTPISIFEYIRISIGGGLLFVVLCMWVLDLINIIFNTFSFRLSKWRFIDCLNTDTRATLGSKYIDKDEYKKPWIVRTFNAVKESIKERKAKKQQKLQTEHDDNQVTEDIDKTLNQADNEQNVVTIQQKPKQTNKQNKKAKIVIKKNIK